ncbi:hypothetical protein GCM10009081_14630 [Brevundimonas nasdae]
MKLTATAGSDDAEIALVPIPRIEKLYMLKLFLEKLTFGMARNNSEPPSIFIASSVSAEKAETAIGTSWMACSRFWAVTMISSTVATAGAVWAKAGAAAHMAMIDAVAAKRARTTDVAI